MIDFSDPQNAHLRLANSERDEAVAQLNANLREGRLDETEFTKRSAVVRTAVTRGDLAPIFGDLPSSAGQATPPSASPYAAPGMPASSVAGSPFDPPGVPGSAYAPPGMSAAGMPGSSIPAPNAGGSGRKGPLGGSAGTVAVSISPFVALILFFLTGALFGWNYSWLWFLLVPVTAVIVYGAGTRDSGRNRDRNR